MALQRMGRPISGIPQAQKWSVSDALGGAMTMQEIAAVRDEREAVRLRQKLMSRLKARDVEWMVMAGSGPDLHDVGQTTRDAQLRIP